MRESVIESIGAVAMVAAATLPVACVHVERPVDLQPRVAAFGAYSTMEPSEDVISGVCSTCGSKVPPGGGWLGDGTVKVPCPECNKSAGSKPCDKCGGDGLVERDGKLYICSCRKCEDGSCTLR